MFGQWVKKHTDLALLVLVLGVTMVPQARAGQNHLVGPPKIGLEILERGGGVVGAIGKFTGWGLDAHEMEGNIAAGSTPDAEYMAWLAGAAATRATWATGVAVMSAPAFACGATIICPLVVASAAVLAGQQASDWARDAVASINAAAYARAHREPTVPGTEDIPDAAEGGSPDTGLPTAPGDWHFDYLGDGYLFAWTAEKSALSGVQFDRLELRCTSKKVLSYFLRPKNSGSILGYAYYVLPESDFWGGYLDMRSGTGDLKTSKELSNHLKEHEDYYRETGQYFDIGFVSEEFDEVPTVPPSMFDIRGIRELRETMLASCTQ